MAESLGPFARVAADRCRCPPPVLEAEACCLSARIASHRAGNGKRASLRRQRRRSRGKLRWFGWWELFSIAIVVGVSAAWALELYRRRFHVQSVRSALESLPLVESPTLTPATIPESLDRSSFYLESLVLKNIRCFDALEIRFAAGEEISPVTLVLGDNATGKSTLLRALAIGLSPESDAVALMKQLRGRSFARVRRKGRSC